MLRTISFREALEKSRQRKRGCEIESDHSVPLLLEYQIAKDIWFWFLKQHPIVQKVEKRNAPCEFNLSDRKTTNAKCQPHAVNCLPQDSCPSSSDSSSNVASNVSLSIDQQNDQIEREHMNGPKNASTSATHDVWRKSMCRFIQQLPPIIYFLIIMQMAAIESIHENQYAVKSEAHKGHWRSFISSRQLDRRLIDLIEQDIQIIYRNMYGCARPPQLFFEDYELVPELTALLHRSVNVSIQTQHQNYGGGSSQHPSNFTAEDIQLPSTLMKASSISNHFFDTNGLLHIGKNVDGDRMMVKFHNEGQTRGFKIFISGCANIVENPQDDGINACEASGVSKSTTLEEQIKKIDAEVANVESPATEPLGMLIPVFKQYRDDLYRGQYEFLEDMGVFKSC